MDISGDGNEFGPWNPGLESRIPNRFLPLSTMFRQENVSTGIAEAKELADFSGLKINEIVAFRPERLIAHELLIRVSADLTVPDGPNYEDLGINLRSMTATILKRHIEPDMESLKRIHDDLRVNATAFIKQEMSEHLFAGPKPSQQPAPGASLLKRLFGGPERTRAGPGADDILQRQNAAIERWRRFSGNPFETACLTALARVVDAIIGQRGRLVGEPETIAGIAVNLVCNGHGSKLMGEAIEPHIRRAAEAEDYRFLPAQDKPVVMNVKGASAAGKSTIRPQQRRLAERLGIPWEDFALISPDYWRKFMLDYESLGEAYKYAAMLTGHELEIIDKKLDRYMADKAARGEMSHLLIDRFRFDSFVVEKGRDVDTPLLTRFGDLIFMFFMITPPDATVERAWVRGIRTGRYKAVDDLLHHNIEAYTGMPQLFFSWASVAEKRIHYEFLDNSVAEDRLPRTVAFGWNGEMTILDIRHLLDISRFRKIDVDAGDPAEVYDEARMAPESNVDFLKQCAERIPAITFADHRTGHVYGRLEQGRWTWRDEAYVKRVIGDADTLAGLDALGWNDTAGELTDTPEPAPLDQEKAYTLGEWCLETRDRND